MDRVSTQELMVRSGLTPINQLVAEVKLFEVWKSLREPPFTLGALFNPIQKTTQMVTKSSNRETLKVPGKSKVSQSGFAASGAILWNSAPSALHEAKTRHQAKRIIKEFVRTLPF